MDHEHYLVPIQQEGIKKDLSYKVATETVADAEDWFVEAKERLLEVNKWKIYAVLETGGFSLTDSHGKKVNRHARKGDHIIIDTGSPKPEDDYMVVIDKLEYDDYPDIDMESFAMHITHFSELLETKKEGANDVLSDASGTLVIERRGKHLSIYYHGRNENVVPDTGIAESDSVPVFDYWLGIAGKVWEQLLKGIAASG